jgi:hypothetical protein
VDADLETHPEPRSPVAPAERSRHTRVPRTHNDGDAWRGQNENGKTSKSEYSKIKLKIKLNVGVRVRIRVGKISTS